MACQLLDSCRPTSCSPALSPAICPSLACHPPICRRSPCSVDPAGKMSSGHSIERILKESTFISFQGCARSGSGGARPVLCVSLSPSPHRGSFKRAIRLVSLGTRLEIGLASGWRSPVPSWIDSSQKVCFHSSLPLSLAPPTCPPLLVDCDGRWLRSTGSRSRGAITGADHPLSPSPPLLALSTHRSTRPPA